MLEIANSDFIAGLMIKQNLLPIFLLLWFTYTLFISFKDKSKFKNWLNPAIKESTFKRVERNKYLKYYNPKYEDLMKLVGLLSYLDITPSRISSIFPSDYLPNTSRSFLDEKLEKLNFQHSCFFLQGVEFLDGKKLSSYYWDLVVKKKDRYKVKTTALQELMDFACKSLCSR
jgi:hypothetical protein